MVINSTQEQPTSPWWTSFYNETRPSVVYSTPPSSSTEPFTNTSHIAEALPTTTFTFLPTIGRRARFQIARSSPVARPYTAESRPIIGRTSHESRPFFVFENRATVAEYGRASRELREMFGRPSLVPRPTCAKFLKSCVLRASFVPVSDEGSTSLGRAPYSLVEWSIDRASIDRSSTVTRAAYARVSSVCQGTAALDSPTVSEQNDRKRDFADLTSADPNKIPEAGFRRSRFHKSESDISNGILWISEFRTWHRCYFPSPAAPKKMPKAEFYGSRFCGSDKDTRSEISRITVLQIQKRYRKRDFTDHGSADPKRYQKRDFADLSSTDPKEIPETQGIL
ncbi:hypothetical protein Bbelb_070480 [Branchiostoma belcheri]|nr:hypothetical protein Bbelb_070480 [Branchiostoma belcheri]